MSSEYTDWSSPKSVSKDGMVAADDLRVEEEASHSRVEHALDHAEPESEKDSAIHGLPLIIFTVGIMSIVFLMCLDHYILGTPMRFLFPSFTYPMNQRLQFLESQPTSAPSRTQGGIAAVTT